MDLFPWKKLKGPPLILQQKDIPMKLSALFADDYSPSILGYLILPFKIISEKSWQILHTLRLLLNGVRIRGNVLS